MLSSSFVLLSTLFAGLSAAQTSDVNFSEMAANKQSPGNDNMTTQAVGQAVIENRCNFPLYLWSVDGDHPNPAHIKINARSRHSEGFRKPSNGGGVSLKVSKNTHNDQHNIVQFEYTIKSGSTWYDMSFVDCARNQNAGACPGHAEGLKISCSNNCPKLTCAPGQYCPRQAYYDPDGPDGPYEPTRSTSSTSEKLIYTVCTKNNPLRKRSIGSIGGRIQMEDDLE